jgi:hypothetical protein
MDVGMEVRSGFARQSGGQIRIYLGPAHHNHPYDALIMGLAIKERRSPRRRAVAPLTTRDEGFHHGTHRAFAP